MQTSLHNAKDMASDVLCKAIFRGPRHYVLFCIRRGRFAAMHPAVADAANFDALAIEQRPMAFATYSDDPSLTNMVAVMPYRQNIHEFVYRKGDVLFNT